MRYGRGALALPGLAERQWPNMLVHLVPLGPGALETAAALVSRIFLVHTHAAEVLEARAAPAPSRAPVGSREAAHKCGAGCPQHAVAGQRRRARGGPRDRGTCVVLHAAAGGPRGPPGDRRDPAPLRAARGASGGALGVLARYAVLLADCVLLAHHALGASTGDLVEAVQRANLTGLSGPIAFAPGSAERVLPPGHLELLAEAARRRGSQIPRGANAWQKAGEARERGTKKTVELRRGKRKRLGVCGSWFCSSRGARRPGHHGAAGARLPGRRAAPGPPHAPGPRAPLPAGARLGGERRGPRPPG